VVEPQRLCSARGALVGNEVLHARRSQNCGCSMSCCAMGACPRMLSVRGQLKAMSSCVSPSTRTRKCWPELVESLSGWNRKSGQEQWSPAHWDLYDEEGPGSSHGCFASRPRVGADRRGNSPSSQRRVPRQHSFLLCVCVVWKRSQNDQGPQDGHLGPRMTSPCGAERVPFPTSIRLLCVCVCVRV
jgi:hypothetical protein